MRRTDLEVLRFVAFGGGLVGEGDLNVEMSYITKSQLLFLCTLFTSGSLLHWEIEKGGNTGWSLERGLWRGVFEEGSVEVEDALYTCDHNSKWPQAELQYAVSSTNRTSRTQRHTPARSDMQSE